RRVWRELAFAPKSRSRGRLSKDRHQRRLSAAPAASPVRDRRKCPKPALRGRTRISGASAHRQEWRCSHARWAQGMARMKVSAPAAIRAAVRDRGRKATFAPVARTDGSAWRFRLTLTALGAALVLSVLIAASVGAVAVPVRTVAEILLH